MPANFAGRTDTGNLPERPSCFVGPHSLSTPSHFAMHRWFRHFIDISAVWHDWFHLYWRFSSLPLKYRRRVCLPPFHTLIVASRADDVRTSYILYILNKWVCHFDWYLSSRKCFLHSFPSLLLFSYQHFSHLYDFILDVSLTISADYWQMGLFCRFESIWRNFRLMGFRFLISIMHRPFFIGRLCGSPSPLKCRLSAKIGFGCNIK
jgi:hypothetical protein